MNNVSSNPSSSYQIDNDELVKAIAGVIEEGHDVDKNQVTIWHTHPSGYVGPSTEDLKYKAPELNYLVVSLPNGEATVF